MGPREAAPMRRDCRSFEARQQSRDEYASESGECESRLLERETHMKKEIHPDYQVATVKCVCGNEFQTRSTLKEIKVEICSACHPFFTGQQKLIDSAGRVERFMKKYGKDYGAAIGGKKSKSKGEKAEPKGEKAEPKGGKAEPKGEKAEPKGEKAEPKGGKAEPKGGKAEPKGAKSDAEKKPSKGEPSGDAPSEEQEKASE
jgi:large subunit ribosomal protein L31